MKMKRFSALVVTLSTSLSMIAAPSARGQQSQPEQGAKLMASTDDIRVVAPALEKYAQGRLLGEVWKRPDHGIAVS